MCILNHNGQLQSLPYTVVQRDMFPAPFLFCEMSFASSYYKNVDCKQFKLFQNLCRKQMNNGREIERKHGYKFH